MTEAQPIADVESARKALKFFRVMAFVVGVGLLVLSLEMTFEYATTSLSGERNPLKWWPGPHGFIYMVYLAATANLGFKVGWSLLKMVGIMLAGCLPFLSFWVERRAGAQVEAQLRSRSGRPTNSEG